MGLGDAYDWVHNQLNRLPKDPLGTPFINGSDNPLDIASGKASIGPDKASTAGLEAAQNKAFGLTDTLGAERAGYTGNFLPGADRGLGIQQQDNISSLAAAAAGRVPSPAEIQLQQMSGVNAARQLGLAAALQGRNPGAALRSGRLGSLATQSDTNIQAAMLRAKEQENARNMLIQALHVARGDEQNLNSQDIDWRKALLSGELGALGTGVDAASAKFKGDSTNAAAQNEFNMDLFKTGGKLLSDRTTKTDIRPTDMSKLAASLKAYRFKYKDEANGEGERVGVMAQDVAKGGAAGKLILRRTPAGKMALDIGNGLGAALAMSAQALREARKAA